jgi:hypothetical protein
MFRILVRRPDGKWLPARVNSSVLAFSQQSRHQEIEFVIHTDAAQSGMGGLEAIQGNYSGLAVALESFTQRKPWRR